MTKCVWFKVILLLSFEVSKRICKYISVIKRTLFLRPFSEISKCADLATVMIRDKNRLQIILNQTLYTYGSPVTKKSAAHVFHLS